MNSSRNIVQRFQSSKTISKLASRVHSRNATTTTVQANLRPLINNQNLRSAAIPEVVAAQVQARVRLNAFEEHGNEDARLTPPDFPGDTKDINKITPLSNTPFLDFYYGRKFTFQTEKLVANRESNKKHHAKTYKGKGKDGAAIRADYFMFKLFLNAINNRAKIPDFYFDSLTTEGMALQKMLANPGSSAWKMLRVTKNFGLKSFIVELPIFRAPAHVLFPLRGLYNYGDKPENWSKDPIVTAIADENFGEETSIKLSAGDSLDIPISKNLLLPAGNFTQEELEYMEMADTRIKVYAQAISEDRPNDIGAISATMQMRISRAEAEFLMKQPFAEIKSTDVYSVLLTYVFPKAQSTGKYYSCNGDETPTFAVSLDRIASVLPEDADTLRRTNEDELAVTTDGSLIYLPSRLNNVEYYDSKWRNILDPEDSGRAGLLNDPNEEYAEDLMQSNDPAKSKKDLANIGSMPVLIDWQNNKFSYTNTTGALNIFDLDNIYTARTMHYMRFLHTSVYDGEAASFLNEMPVFMDIAGLSQDNYDIPRSFAEYLQRVCNSLGYMSAEDSKRLPLVAIPYTAVPYYQTDTAQEFESNNRIFRPMDLAKAKPEDNTDESFTGKTKSANKQALLNSVGIMAAAEALLAAMQNNPEKFYRARSIISCYTMIAKLKVFTSAKDLPGLMKKYADETRNYRTQAKDPNFKMEALPLVKSDPPLKPQFHQENVLNLLRSNPDSAILPVSAGGGKTILAIVDILRQIDRGETGPFIVACPPSLVPDYVGEIVYATQGRLNPIPIVTDVWDTHAVAIPGSLRAMVKNAPVNTVLIVGYRTLILKNYEVAYGSQKITVYPVIQFLRSFRPTYVFFDECHELRNPTSETHKAALKLISGVKKKRIASGTLVANTINDLVGQIRLIDPTLFGNAEQFAETYTEKVGEGKKRKARVGAEAALKNLLRENMVIAGAARTQWAYKLPKQERKFLKVDLTPLQQVVHDFILARAIEGQESSGGAAEDDNTGIPGTPNGESATEQAQRRYEESVAIAKVQIAKDIAAGLPGTEPHVYEGPSLIKEAGGTQVMGVPDLTLEAIRNVATGARMDTDEDDDVEEDENENLKEEKQLSNNYLVEVESFIANPKKFEAVMYAISEQLNLPFLKRDLVSPKVQACVERIQEHLATTPEGKFIVFCNYNDTREAIYEALPDSIKAVTLNYLAAQKLTQRKEFLENDAIRGLIGIEKSLSTGFNLQVGTRLIRVETVWTPAAVEQGDSRINRPNVKKGETRDKIYYDVIVADRTIDIAKSSYLVSKMITQIKFDQTEAVSLEDDAARLAQTENPFYTLQIPDPFSLSPQAILDNSEASKMAVDYLNPLEEIRKLLENTYAEFAIRNKDKLFTNPDSIEVDPVTPRNSKFPIELVKKENAIPEKEAPKNAFLMHRIPYTVGMELYRADALGLVPYQEWLERMGFTKYLAKNGVSASLRLPDEVKFGTPQYKEEVKKYNTMRRSLEKDFVKKHSPRVHTGFGDGRAYNVADKTLNVTLNSGEKISVLKNAAFVITRTYTNVADMRRAILSGSKLPIKDANMKDMTPVRLDQLQVEEGKNRQPVAAPARPATPKPPVKQPVAVTPQEDENHLQLRVMLVNGYPALQIQGDVLARTAEGKLRPSHIHTKELVTNTSFKIPNKKMYLIQVKNGANVVRLISTLEKAGFNVMSAIRTRLMDYANYVEGGSGLLNILEHNKLPPLDTELISKLYMASEGETADGRKRLCPYPYVVGKSSLQLILPSTPNTREALQLIGTGALANVKYALKDSTVLSSVFLDEESAKEEVDVLLEKDLISEAEATRVNAIIDALTPVTPVSKLSSAYTPMLGESAAPAAAPVKKPTAPAPKPTAPAAKPAANKPTVNLEIAAYNTFAAIEYDPTEAEEGTVETMQDLGFSDAHFIRVPLRTRKALLDVINNLQKVEGYSLPKESMAALRELNKSWSTHPSPDKLIQVASSIHSKMERNIELLTMTKGPTHNEEGKKYAASVKFAVIIPIVTNDGVFLAAPARHKDSVNAMRLAARSLSAAPVERMVKLFTTRPEMGAFLNSLLPKVNIENKVELAATFKTFRVPTAS